MTLPYTGVQQHMSGGHHIRYQRKCAEVFRLMRDPGATVLDVVVAANEGGLKFDIRFVKPEEAK